MNPRELINHLAAEDTGAREISRILSTLRKGPIEASEIADQCVTSHGGIQETLSPLESIGAIRCYEDDTYDLSVGGEVIRLAYLDVRNHFSAERLAKFSNSAKRISVLRELRRNPGTVAELEKREGLPSYSTIDRAIKDYSTIGWLTRNGQYHLTESGEQAISSYNDMERAGEQVASKSSCLRDLDHECAPIPVTGLGNSELVEVSPMKPMEVRNRYIKLVESGFEHFRGFSSYFDSEYAEAFAPSIEAEKQFELVISEPAFNDMVTNPEVVKYASRTDSAAEADSFVYPGQLPLGLAIFDEREIVIGASNPTDSVARAGNLDDPDSENIGTIFSKDDELIEWGIRLFEQYRGDAQEPLRYVVNRFRSSVQGVLDPLSKGEIRETSSSD